MSLPTLSSPKYQLVLPSSGETVTYRPFTVREEKNLLIAMQSNNRNDHIGTVVNVISTCLDEDISVEDLTMNDIEYLMVKLRTTSVGESVKMMGTCEKCEETQAVEIDLTDFYVKGDSKDGDRIELTDDIGLIMQLPRLKTTRKFAMMNADKMKIEDLENESGANNVVSPGHVSEGARVCALCRGKDANIGMACHRAPGTYRLPATVINVTHCLLQASTVKHKINQTKNQSSTP